MSWSSVECGGAEHNMSTIVVLFGWIGTHSGKASIDPVRMQPNGRLQRRATQRTVRCNGCEPYHLLIARIFAARCCNASASAFRFVARYKAARFSRLVATLGWSGPSAFSRIASARL